MLGFANDQLKPGSIEETLQNVVFFFVVVLFCFLLLFFLIQFNSIFYFELN